MKPAVKYGLISGIVGVLFNLVMYITGINRTSSIQIIQWLTVIIPIAFMYMAIKTYREEIGNGWITFGKAFNQAFIVGIVGGLIGSVYHFLYLKFIDPTYSDYLMQVQLEKMTERGMSDEIIDKAMKQMEPFMTPVVQLGFAIFFSLFIAAVLGLIMAGIMKKPNPEEIV